jgi:membrane protein
MTLRGFWPLCRESIREWREDRGSLLASSISYYAVFSIIPVAILLMGLAGLFTGTEAVEREVLRQIEHVISAKAADSVQSFLSASRESGAGIASLFSGLLLLLLGSRVFVHLEIALNILWRVDRKRGIFGGLVRKRLLSFAMMMGTGFFLLVFFVLNSTVQLHGSIVPEPLRYAFLWRTGSESVSAVLFAALFGLAYRYIPDARVRWEDVGWGAVLTAALFAGGRFLFALYFERIDVFSAYGAAGSLVVIMTWISFSAHIFLFGAKFTHVYARSYGSLRGK